MSAGDKPEPEPPKHMLRPWTRRLWIAAATGLLITVSPFAVAMVGLALDSQYLMTYHWLVYFSAPVGMPIALISGLAAVVMTARNLSNGKKRSDE